MKAPHKNMWELKEEYRHYKSHTTDSSNWMILHAAAAADDDDDDGGTRWASKTIPHHIFSHNQPL